MPYDLTSNQIELLEAARIAQTDGVYIPAEDTERTADAQLLHDLGLARFKVEMGRPLLFSETPHQKSWAWTGKAE